MLASNHTIVVDLMEVLMGSCGRNERETEECVGKHVVKNELDDTGSR